ncbi:MAG: DUF421 domain-containing protein [Actinomycetota bacterium]
MDGWDGLFGTEDHILWWQECARAVVVMAFGLALVRMGGQRLFGKMSALDIIVSIIVGSNLSRALTGGAPLLATMAATALLTLLHWVLAQAAARSARLSRLLEGRTIRLGRGGGIDADGLARHGISRCDLDEALRAAGVETVSQTRLIALEPSGRITVIRAVPPKV